MHHGAASCINHRGKVASVMAYRWRHRWHNLQGRYMLTTHMADMFKFGVGRTVELAIKDLEKYPDSLLCVLAKETARDTSTPFFDAWSDNTVECIADMYRGRTPDVEDMEEFVRALEFFQIPDAHFPLGASCFAAYGRRIQAREDEHYTKAEQLFDKITSCTVFGDKTKNKIDQFLWLLGRSGKVYPVPITLYSKGKKQDGYFPTLHFMYIDSAVGMFTEMEKAEIEKATITELDPDAQVFRRFDNEDIYYLQMVSKPSLMTVEVVDAGQKNVYTCLLFRTVGSKKRKHEPFTIV